MGKWHKHKGSWLRRSLGPWMAWYAMHGCKALLQAMPLWGMIPVGTAIGRLMYRALGSRRQVALENMKLALGGRLTPAERRQTLRRFMEEVAISLMELGHHRYLRRENLRECVDIQGRGHLDRALQQERGAILATAHLGNFPLMLARLALEGYPVGVVIRDPRHRPMARFLDHWREQMGIITLRDKPRWASVRDSVRLIRENGIVVLHTDLNVSRSGVFVPLFGHWVPTFQGPAVLSLRTGAPLIPAFIQRVRGIHHRITIHPPVVVREAEESKEAGWFLLRRLTEVTEGVISENPDQWLWIHRRFRKARPPEEVGRPVSDVMKSV